jgi:riboflavin kinase / FMN hydrolase
LLICGYIRPEANFSSLEALIERIQEDRRVTELALQDATLAAYKADPFLLPSTSPAVPEESLKKEG